jgi:hypothetical protein
MGELAQLRGRPALVDTHAQGPIEALIIPPDQLRALLIAEAELGERVMRALILRRVGLLETGGARYRRLAVGAGPQAARLDPGPCRGGGAADGVHGDDRAVSWKRMATRDLRTA